MTRRPTDPPVGCLHPPGVILLLPCFTLGIGKVPGHTRSTAFRTISLQFSLYLCLVPHSFSRPSVWVRSGELTLPFSLGAVRPSSNSRGSSFPPRPLSDLHVLFPLRRCTVLTQSHPRCVRNLPSSYFCSGRRGSREGTAKDLSILWPLTSSRPQSLREWVWCLLGPRRLTTRVGTCL